MTQPLFPRVLLFIKSFDDPLERDYAFKAMELDIDIQETGQTYAARKRLTNYWLEMTRDKDLVLFTYKSAKTMSLCIRLGRSAIMHLGKGMSRIDGLQKDELIDLILRKLKEFRMADIKRNVLKDSDEKKTFIDKQMLISLQMKKMQACLQELLHKRASVI